ncbi:DUF6042 family protein [Streptomyces sp. NBC_01216]|uniref:DUF6042 family protein n=1 Tax=unclassified Streptomyces TaxID=2593676 RepID=UPI002E10F104|nr:DUF6042 family protein [Streptomyces sp. NBC_01216]
MSVVQKTKQAGRDRDLALHTGWFPSGWPEYLPQHQAMMLCMLFGTATLRELRGDVDDVLRQLLDGRPSAFFGRDGDTLDSPVMWLDPDELDYAETDKERERLRADAEARRVRCADLFRGAGLPVPTTIRELADTMLALGIATVRDGVWSMPDVLPGPEDVLPLTDAERADIENMRRVWDIGSAENALIGYLTDELDRPDELFTSVDRLANATGLDEDDVRQVLGHMITEGEVRLERGQAREQVALDCLKGHTRFHLVTDWQHFDENRVVIDRG